MKSKVLILFVVLLVGFGTAGFAGGNQQRTPPTMPEHIAAIPQSSSWTAVTDNPFSGGTIWDIAYGNGKFVAVGNEGRIAYSTDGINWTEVQDSPFSTTKKYNYNEARTVSYGNGRFVAGGYQGNSEFSINNIIAYSSDGVTWTEAADSTFGSSTWINHIAYGGTAGQEKFIASGAKGKMAYSLDGITWTAITNSRLSGGINVFYVGGKWIASGDYGQMAYSADGVTWTVIPAGQNPFSSSNISVANIHKIAYGNGRFVATGWRENFKMAYSSDGINWTEVTGIPPLDISGVTYGNGKFVAAGTWGVTASSTDGVNWTFVRISEELGFRSIIFSVIYGGGKWVVGSAYNEGVIAWSTTGE